ncbi:hypothetical protein C1646_778533 [Rhizophagus diaphanus]|nr:hypothetical protein C1646_778533 [Rhizophagus diaphanus] [Rhizophagus sp. MUCL 43196]
MSLNGTLQEVEKKIAKIIECADRYYYIYRKAYQSEKYNHCNIWYYCSQSCSLVKHSQKYENQDKQCNREHIERFVCNGILKVLLNMENKRSSILEKII